MHTLTPPKDNLFSAHVGRVEPPIISARGVCTPKDNRDQRTQWNLNSTQQERPYIWLI